MSGDRLLALSYHVLPALILGRLTARFFACWEFNTTSISDLSQSKNRGVFCAPATSEALAQV
jgi:hypothetical protein